VREIRTPSSMSGKERRSDGLLGERGNERRCAPQAPPVLHATALLLDSTPQVAAVLRRIGIVALARKLLIAFWRYLETGVVPDGAQLKPMEV
jgi:hypothetical protein